jgi:hypothetical protein
MGYTKTGITVNRVYESMICFLRMASNECDVKWKKVGEERNLTTSSKTTHWILA